MDGFTIIFNVFLFFYYYSFKKEKRKKEKEIIITLLLVLFFNLLFLIRMFYTVNLDHLSRNSHIKKVRFPIADTFPWEAE